MQKILTTVMLALLTLMGGTEYLYASHTERQEEQTKQEPMVLKGMIGEYPVTMFFTSNWWDDDLQGYYYYNSRPKSHLKLKCTRHELEDSNNLTYVQYGVTIEEYTRKGSHSGTFVGVIFNRAGISTTFSGTFTNSKGKEFEFMVQHLDQ